MAHIYLTLTFNTATRFKLSTVLATILRYIQTLDSRAEATCHSSQQERRERGRRVGFDCVALKDESQRAPLASCDGPTTGHMVGNLNEKDQC